MNVLMRTHRFLDYNATLFGNYNKFCRVWNYLLPRTIQREKYADVPLLEIYPYSFS
jgi:hypothetical protein